MSMLPAGVVEASPSMAIVLLIAPLAGLFALLIRMLGRSSQLRLSLTILRRSKADVTAIAAYDIVGGLLCGAGVLILGITRPPALAAAFETKPLLAWSIVGASGPLLAAGVIDRLPLRSFADFFVNNGGRSVSSKWPEMAPVPEVRLQASQHILLRLYQEVRVTERIICDHHGVTARKLFEAGHLTFDDVTGEIKRFASDWSKQIPEEVKELMGKRTMWPGPQDPGRETVLLVDTCLNLGFEQPIIIANRVAAERAA
jgi:hypothetical protein